jgi:hypothetical protein
MYNEIQSILNQSPDSGAEARMPVFDEDAAVKYVVWDSYDFSCYKTFHQLLTWGF